MLHYSVNNLFAYAKGYYMILPKGLPERFYPKEKENIHDLGIYVICFKKDTPKDIKHRFIIEYEKYYNETILNGIVDGIYKDG